MALTLHEAIVIAQADVDIDGSDALKEAWAVIQTALAGVQKPLLKYKVLVAHQSHPEHFRHEIDIDFVGADHTEVAQEIIDLLNENNLRDCIFKIDDSTAEGCEAPDRTVCGTANHIAYTGRSIKARLLCSRPK